MKLLRRLVCALAAVVAVGTASGQAPDVLRDGSDDRLLECLQPAPEAMPPVVYPPDAVLLKQDAIVRVRMAFTQPDKAPDATVFFNLNGDAFGQAALQAVKAYRLPCLPPGRAQPLVVTQEFRFDPRDGRPVVWNPLRKSPDAVPSNDCDFSLPDRPPEYPAGALTSSSSAFKRRSHAGAVLALMEFTSADLLVPWVFSARNESDDTRFALKDIPLKTFVASVKNLDRQQVSFDFGTMGCPFEVQLNLYQPYLENSVGEVGTADPNRADFVAWLRQVSLQLPADAARHLVGASTRIIVPCGSLNLRG